MRLISTAYLVDDVPFLEDDLVPLGASLGRNQLLQVADSVVLVALPPHLGWGKSLSRNLGFSG